MRLLLLIVIAVSLVVFVRLLYLRATLPPAAPKRKVIDMQEEAPERDSDPSGKL